MRGFNQIVVSAISVFFILSLVGYGYIEYGLPWEHGHVKERMHAHLEDKFKETFEFGSLRYDLLHGGKYFTYATSEQTGVTFYVEASDTAVTDSYSYSYWQKEGDRFILPPIREYYKELNYVSVSLDVEILQQIESEPDQRTLKEQALWHIDFSLPYEMTAENERTELEKAYGALLALKEANVQVASYSVHFINHAIDIPEEAVGDITSVQSLKQHVITTEEMH